MKVIIDLFVLVYLFLPADCISCKYTCSNVTECPDINYYGIDDDGVLLNDTQTFDDLITDDICNLRYFSLRNNTNDDLNIFIYPIVSFYTSILNY